MSSLTLLLAFFVSTFALPFEWKNCAGDQQFKVEQLVMVPYPAQSGYGE
jgi:hypothetical protein